MINFLNLQYFLVLSEEMNFRKAADKLYITQQSLSGHIQKLEDFFGVPLFNRGTPLTLTPAGYHLKKRAAELITIQSDLQQELVDISGFIGGSLTVGSTHVRAQVLLPSIINTFHRQYPSVKIKLFEGNTSEVEDALKSGQLDVSIGFLPTDTQKITSIPLYGESFVIVIPDNLLAEYFPNDVSIRDKSFTYEQGLLCLEKLPFIAITNDTKLGSFCEKFFRNLGITPNIFLETINIGTLLSMCSEGLGAIVCPMTFIRYSYYDFSHHKICIIEDELSKRPIVVNYLSKKYQSKTLMAFISTVRMMLGEPEA